MQSCRSFLSLFSSKSNAPTENSPLLNPNLINIEAQNTRGETSNIPGSMQNTLFATNQNPVSKQDALKASIHKLAIKHKLTSEKNLSEFNVDEFIKKHTRMQQLDDAIGITPSPCTTKDPVCGCSITLFSAFSFAGGMLRLYSANADEDAAYCPKNPINYTQELINQCIEAATQTSEHTALASNIMFGLTGAVILIASSYLLSKQIEKRQLDKLMSLCGEYAKLQSKEEPRLTNVKTL